MLLMRRALVVGGIGTNGDAVVGCGRWLTAISDTRRGGRRCGCCVLGLGSEERRRHYAGGPRTQAKVGTRRMRQAAESKPVIAGRGEWESFPSEGSGRDHHDKRVDAREALSAAAAAVRWYERFDDDVAERLRHNDDEERLLPRSPYRPLGFKTDDPITSGELRPSPSSVKKVMQMRAQAASRGGSNDKKVNGEDDEAAEEEGRRRRRRFAELEIAARAAAATAAAASTAAPPPPKVMQEVVPNDSSDFEFDEMDIVTRLKVLETVVPEQNLERKKFRIREHRKKLARLARRGESPPEDPIRKFAPRFDTQAECVAWFRVGEKARAREARKPLGQLLVDPSKTFHANLKNHLVYGYKLMCSPVSEWPAPAKNEDGSTTILKFSDKSIPFYHEQMPEYSKELRSLKSGSPQDFLQPLFNPHTLAHYHAFIHMIMCSRFRMHPDVVNGLIVQANRMNRPEFAIKIAHYCDLHDVKISDNSYRMLCETAALTSDVEFIEHMLDLIRDQVFAPCIRSRLFLVRAVAINISSLRAFGVIQFFEDHVRDDRVPIDQTTTKALVSINLEIANAIKGGRPRSPTNTDTLESLHECTKKLLERSYQKKIIDNNVRRTIGRNMIKAFGAFDDLDRAEQVYRKLREVSDIKRKPPRDAILDFNTMLGVYADRPHGMSVAAKRVFKELVSAPFTKPDETSVKHLLRVLARDGLWEDSQRVLETVTRLYGLEVLPEWWAIHVEALVKAGRIVEADAAALTNCLDPTSPAAECLHTAAVDNGLDDIAERWKAAPTL